MKSVLGKYKRGLIGWISNKLQFQLPQVLLPKQTIGKTVAGKDIEAFFTGNTPQKLLFIFGLHGNETGTVKLGYDFLGYIEKNRIYKDISFIIIPCLNVDGYNTALKDPDYFGGGRIGRFNSNNVDLNRNYDTKSFQKTSNWTHGKNYQESTPIYCGTNGNSEPETKAVTNLILKNKIKYIFIFHNVGSDVLGAKDDISELLAKIYSEKANFKYMSQNEWKKLNHTGTPKEWCEDHGVHFLEIEGTNRWKSDWLRQKPAIEAIIKYLSDIDGTRSF